MPPLPLILKAIRELGPMRIGRYALYQAGLRSGYYRFLTRRPELGNWPLTLDRIRVPSRSLLEQTLGERGPQVVGAAHEIAAGTYRQWGGDPVPLALTVPGPLEHWTAYESGHFEGRDIKYTWEPARFGWALALARAHILTGEMRFADTFHRNLRSFLDSNPPYRGPNWASAQEVALRLISLVIAFRVFPNPPPDAGQIIADHAARIPPTLFYAHAQNNNHLLSEAAGLYTAGLVLPDHPKAGAWRETGWQLLNRGFQTQIAGDGTYMQQSANYHRLMLQLALWGNMLSAGGGGAYPEKTRRRLAAATHWLLSLTNPKNGRVPNLGANDGAYILPMTVCDFFDYRPVLQAASNAFLKEQAFEPGVWDEMKMWFGDFQGSDEENKSDAPRALALSEAKGPPRTFASSKAKGPLILHHNTLSARAYLRAAKFTERPGHADQLHVDLWWRGLNIAHDPGTFSYNAAPPWQNSLTTAHHHNTVTVNGCDQMTRAGRFLYVDRAQARILESSEKSAAAEHDGYRAFGITHKRSLEPTDDGWKITDLIDSSVTNRKSSISIHWQLPDWPWRIEGLALRTKSPHGWITLTTENMSPIDSGTPIQTLVRAGELIYGPGSPLPTQGWYSPTYGVKMPALSYTFSVERPLPVKLISAWRFPEN